MRGIFTIEPRMEEDVIIMPLFCEKQIVRLAWQSDLMLKITYQAAPKMDNPMARPMPA